MIFQYFSRQIWFLRTFQESPINSSTFQASANPDTDSDGVDQNVGSHQDFHCDRRIEDHQEAGLQIRVRNWKLVCLISRPKYILWVLKRTVSMRRFFWAPKTYVKTNGYENIYNFRLIFFLLIWTYDVTHGRHQQNFQTRMIFKYFSTQILFSRKSSIIQVLFKPVRNRFFFQI